MGAPVPSASHEARTIISYFILYISTLRRRDSNSGNPEEAKGAGSNRKRVRESIIREIIVEIAS